MTDLLDRLGSADGWLARSVDKVAARFLPQVTASAACPYICTGTPCYVGHYRCEYCNGYYTGRCYCDTQCLG